MPRGKRYKLTPEDIARNERIKKAQEETLAVVRSGKCPLCGSKVVRNFSLTGWWQCEQFGAPQFRKRPEEPPCPWQGFTV